MDCDYRTNDCMRMAFWLVYRIGHDPFIVAYGYRLQLSSIRTRSVAASSFNPALQETGPTIRSLNIYKTSAASPKQVSTQT